MMVICTDAFARDYNGGRSETVHARNLSEDEAKLFADELNKKFGGEGSASWFVVKPDTYEPYEFTGY